MMMMLIILSFTVRYLSIAVRAYFSLVKKMGFNDLSLPFFHLIPKRGYTPVLSLKYAYVLWGNICKVLTVRSKLSFVAIH